MDSVQTRRLSGRATAIICALLLAMYATVSFSAVLTKSATIDEPTHLLSGWLSLRLGDFRYETVNPSLWKMFAALADVTVDLKLPPEPAIWNNCTWNTPPIETGWSCRTLYQTPGTDGGALVNRARALMLALAIAMGALVARWTYRLGGPVAAIVATMLFCLDPTLIAHGPLVKSDVAFGLDLLALAYVAWQVGERATWPRIIALGLICGAAAGTKYSGLIAGPILAIMLALRAMLPDPWDIPGHQICSRIRKLCFAAVVCVFAACCCYVITWASYGFRFGPAPSPDVRMDMQAVYERARLAETSLDIPHPTPQQMNEHPPSLTYRFVQWADRVHFLPQPMLAGLLYQHTCVTLWPGFLNGELYGTGRWSYFPLAMVYKTPVSELAIHAAGLTVLVANMRKFRQHRWTILCLGVPAGVFGLAAMSTHLNIGVRNVLPLFSFIEIAGGCAAAICWQRWRRGTIIVLGALFIGLATETLGAWPDFIAYFNFPSGGEVGGIAHLADSNLDWGQDLIGLAKWQESHRDVELFAKLNYSADPRFYGLDYHPIFIVPDGPDAGQWRSDIPLRRGVLAVSATQLQGLYLKPFEWNFYQRLRRLKPIAIIGGTIYLYAFDS
jgi:hypothetical protein